MNKQNELILTESALEDFKIFKMYMEKKKNLFCISLPICCFQKTAALCGFSHVVDYQQVRTSIQSLISSFTNYSHQATTNDMKRSISSSPSCLTDLNGLVEGLY